jgi:hypothetical protein
MNIKEQTKFIVFKADIVCWKCKNKIEVYCLGTKNGYLKNVSKISKNALAEMENILEVYFEDESFGIGSFYMNHCKECGSKQGEFYLHLEPDGPFFIDKSARIHKTLTVDPQIETAYF